MAGDWLRQCGMRSAECSLGSEEEDENEEEDSTPPSPPVQGATVLHSLARWYRIAIQGATQGATKCYRGCYIFRKGQSLKSKVQSRRLKHRTWNSEGGTRPYRLGGFPGKVATSQQCRENWGILGFKVATKVATFLAGVATFLSGDLQRKVAEGKKMGQEYGRRKRSERRE
jgi:hypothetical protein